MKSSTGNIYSTACKRNYLGVNRTENDLTDSNDNFKEEVSGPRQ